MLTFLRTSIGADSPRFQQELFTNFRDTLERPFCVLLTGKYKCTNKNTVLLQSLFNNQLPWAGALGFLLHFYYCDLLSPKDKKSVSQLDFRTDHRVFAGSVWAGNKKSATIDDVSCSHLPEQKNMAVAFVCSSIVDGVFGFSHGDTLLKPRCLANKNKTKTWKIENNKRLF